MEVPLKDDRVEAGGAGGDAGGDARNKCSILMLSSVAFAVIVGCCVVQSSFKGGHSSHDWIL